MNGVFISYASADRSFASKLANDLKSKGLNVWFDQWELKVGDSLTHKIGSAIKTQDFLIVVLSKASVESEWVLKELSIGLMRELEERRVVVLPIVIEDCDIPPLLSDKVYADFRRNYASGLVKLFGRFPDRLFPSGISMKRRIHLSSNVRMDNVTTKNIIDIIT
ncbi:toll/interleukin-1 receptor domain-containing protein [Chloroflexota bacterium]